MTLSHPFTSTWFYWLTFYHLTIWYPDTCCRASISFNHQRIILSHSPFSSPHHKSFPNYLPKNWITQVSVLNAPKQLWSLQNAVATGTDNLFLPCNANILKQYKRHQHLLKTTQLESRSAENIWVLLDHKLIMSHQCSLMAKKKNLKNATSILGCIRTCQIWIYWRESST